MKSPRLLLSQLKIIEYKNKIVTDEINTNKDLATRAIANWRSIPYSFKKQILSTYEMSMTEDWSQIPMMICDSSDSEQAKQFHMTYKKQ